MILHKFIILHLSRFMTTLFISTKTFTSNVTLLILARLTFSVHPFYFRGFIVIVHTLDFA